jgi:DNA (cytosine-5)-methyltransferase 1
VTGRPRLLDLFCGAGGAARGYRLAGFHVTGIDIQPQPEYAGDEFVQADIAEWLDIDYATIRGLRLRDFDAIHASPPCQAFTNMSNRWRGKGGLADQRLNLIPVVREALEWSGLPYVIENVVDARAELRDPTMLCGRSLGLTIHRHRLFEANWLMLRPPCVGGRDPFGVYGAADGRRLWRRNDGSVYRAWKGVEEGQRAMEMPWCSSVTGLREAIPPAMTEYIGHQLLAHVRQETAA